MTDTRAKWHKCNTVLSDDVSGEEGAFKLQLWVLRPQQYRIPDQFKATSVTAATLRGLFNLSGVVRMKLVTDSIFPEQYLNYIMTMTVNSQLRFQQVYSQQGSENVAVYDST